MGKRIIIKGGNFMANAIGSFTKLSNNLVLVADKSLFTERLENQIIGNPVENMIISNQYTGAYSVQKLEVTNKQGEYYIEITHNFSSLFFDEDGVYPVALIADSDGNLIKAIQCYNRDSTLRTETHKIIASDYENIGFIYITGLKSNGYYVSMKN